MALAIRQTAVVLSLAAGCAFVVSTYERRYEVPFPGPLGTPKERLEKQLKQSKGLYAVAAVGKGKGKDV